jgi:hypothetical protein
MKYAALALITTFVAGPVLANKLHQQQPTASEVKAWQADHSKIKQKEQKRKNQKAQLCCKRPGEGNCWRSPAQQISPYPGQLLSRLSCHQTAPPPVAGSSP